MRIVVENSTGIVFGHGDFIVQTDSRIVIDYGKKIIPQLNNSNSTVWVVDRLPKGYQAQGWTYINGEFAPLGGGQKRLDALNNAKTKRKMAALEAEITPRRLADAIIGNDGGWLASKKAAIEAEEAKLVAIEGEL